MTEFGLPADWRFWERHDVEFLRRCNELVVLKLDGWRESRGVQAEIACPGVAVMLALAWARRMWISTRKDKRP